MQFCYRGLVYNYNFADAALKNCTGNLQAVSKEKNNSQLKYRGLNYRLDTTNKAVKVNNSQPTHPLIYRGIAHTISTDRP